MSEHDGTYQVKSGRLPEAILIMATIWHSNTMAIAIEILIITNNMIITNDNNSNTGTEFRNDVIGMILVTISSHFCQGTQG